MNVNIEELERLARAATPGPWDSRVCEYAIADTGDSDTEFSVHTKERMIAHVVTREPQDEADSAYIAAVNPAVILALIEQLSAYPADWRKDSSLETWFPFTAEQVKAQQAEIARLRQTLETIAAYPYSRDQEMGVAAMRKLARDTLDASTTSTGERK